MPWFMDGICDVQSQRPHRVRRDVSSEKDFECVDEVNKCLARKHVPLEGFEPFFDDTCSISLKR